MNETNRVGKLAAAILKHSVGRTRALSTVNRFMYGCLPKQWLTDYRKICILRGASAYTILKTFGVTRKMLPPNTDTVTFRRRVPQSIQERS